MGSMLFVHADRLLIGSFLGAHALAYYSVCVQLAQQVHQLPASAMSILFPLISRKLHAGEHASADRVRNAGIAVNLAASLVLGLALLIAGPRLLELWMGAAFAQETGNLLRWLTAAYFLLSLNVAPYYLLMGYDEMRYVSVTSLGGAAAGVVAALLLLPAVGVTGAAQARMALGLTTLANYWRVYRPARGRA
jgi:O-antigen/teichoic acid export membrane protein